MAKAAGKETRNKNELEREVFDRALDEAIDQAPDEATKEELRKLRDELNRELKRNAEAAAKEIAKRLLSRLLEIFGAGAGRFAGPLLFLWQQAGEFGSALGNFIRQTLDKAINDRAITWLNQGFQVIEDVEAPNRFAYAIQTQIIIVDKAGKPIDASYTIRIAKGESSRAAPFEIQGTTGADGYDYQTQEQLSKSWPYKLKEVEVDIDSINSVEYAYEAVKGNVCDPKPVIAFRYLIKVVAARSSEGGGYFYMSLQGGEFALGSPVRFSLPLEEPGQAVLHRPRVAGGGRPVKLAIQHAAMDVSFAQTQLNSYQVVRLSGFAFSMEKSGGSWPMSPVRVALRENPAGVLGLLDHYSHDLVLSFEATFVFGAGARQETCSGSVMMEGYIGKNMQAVFRGLLRFTTGAARPPKQPTPRKKQGRPRQSTTRG